MPEQEPLKSVAEVGLTPIGLMIPVLNRWLTESVEPAADCAEVLLDTLREAGFTLVRDQEHAHG